MVTIEEVRAWALAFEGTEELPHFENISFRVKKKIFATVNPAANRSTLKFSEIDQSVFCAFDKTVIYPVPNAWGKQGWTNIELSKVEEETFKDALTVAYCTVAPTKLAEKYRREN